jgi:hypothetical protein
MRKVTAFILVIAIISTLGISAKATEEPPIPNYYTDGELTIGFFNFVNGRGTHLEVRLQRAPAGFGITQSYSLSGITRVRDMIRNYDLFEGTPEMGSIRPNEILFTGGISFDFGFKSGDIAASASVDGIGTITFGEGDFAILWPDRSETIFNLSGVTLSNIQKLPINDTIPNCYTIGELTIGFFEFTHGRSAQLEVRLDRLPAGFGIHQSCVIKGITRIRHTYANDEFFWCYFNEVSKSSEMIYVAGLQSKESLEFNTNDTILFTQVDGTGTITFGEGEFAVIWQDGTEMLYDLSGVTISNIKFTAPEVVEVPVSTTEPVTSAAVTVTTTVETEENPHTGVGVSVIPVIIAAVLFTVKKRRVL